jgi:hypothetical protein
MMKKETVVIREHAKNYYCGGYGFYLYRGKLVVLAPIVNTPDNPQYHYEMRGMPENQWFALEDTRGERLPVYVLWNRLALRIQVGAPPQEGEIPSWAVREYSQAWSFEVRRDATYMHPDEGFWMKFSTGYHYVSFDEIMVAVNVAGEAVRINAAYLPERQWTILTYPPPNRQNLPIMVYKDQKRLFARWLPLDSLAEQDQPLDEATSRLIKGEAAKRLGMLDAIGINGLVFWLLGKGREK